MRLEEIQAEIEKDSKIDNTNLDSESLRIPLLYSKYYNIFISEFKVLKGIEIEYNRVKKERHQYYLGQSKDEIYKEEPMNIKVLRQDLDLYLDSDPRINEIKTKYDLQKTKTELVENFMKTLNTRNFLIKNAIDFLRFKSGG